MGTGDELGNARGKDRGYRKMTHLEHLRRDGGLEGEKLEVSSKGNFSKRHNLQGQTVKKMEGGGH